MKKLTVLVVALVSMLVFGGIAIGANRDDQKFESDVSLKFKAGDSAAPYDPYAEAFFKGRVSSPKALCEKDRKIVLKVDGQGLFGADTTDDQGRYKIAASGIGSGPSDYQAKAKRKVREKKNGDEIICKSAKSGVVTAP